jgi:hypothetical protein
VFENIFSGYRVYVLVFFVADLRVDWRVYNREDNNDERLVDFLVSYGRTFPPLDADGQEIRPKTPGVLMLFAFIFCLFHFGKILDLLLKAYSVSQKVGKGLKNVRRHRWKVSIYIRRQYCENELGTT